MAETGYLDAPFETKAVDLGQRIVSGWAAAYALDRVGDRIQPGAFRKTLEGRSPADVALLIGHRQDTLPVGVPIKFAEDSRGLFMEAYIFEGPQGDAILHAVKGLQRHGSTLGCSIGYRVPQGGSELVQEPDGKGMVRYLTQVDLIEVSLAARQTIANQDALITSVKTADPPLETKPAPHMAMCRLRPPSSFEAGSFRTMERDHAGKTYQVVMGRLKGEDTMSEQALHYPTAEGWDAAAARAHCESHGGQEFAAATGDGGKQMEHDDEVAVKATWSAAMQNSLPDSHFLWIEDGGTKDDEGKTVPRSKRHFPYKSADGTVDLPHLRDAIGRIPQSNAEGLSDSLKRTLQARARRMLDNAGGGDGKQVDVESAPWQAGAVPTLAWAGYALLDLSERVATAQTAWGTLGEDIKSGSRVPPELMVEAAAIAGTLHQLSEWAATVQAGADAVAEVARFEQELALLDL